MRRTTSRLGGACAIGMAGFIGTAGAGCAQIRYTEVFIPDHEVRRVLVDVEDGDVEVVPAGSVRVERAVRGPEGVASLSHSLDADGTLRLHAACPGMLPCGVDTRLAVPASVPVSITLAEGDVWVTGLDELRLDLADGSADVEVDGRLVASVGAGSVRAWLGADTQASVAVGRGDVDVVVASVTHGLDLSARSRDVVGIIPDDAAVGRLEIMAPAGHARVRGGRGVARR